MTAMEARDDGTGERGAGAKRVARAGGGGRAPVRCAVAVCLGLVLGDALAAESPFALAPAVAEAAPPGGTRAALSSAAPNTLPDVLLDAASASAPGGERALPRAPLVEPVARDTLGEETFHLSYHGELVDTKLRALEPTPELVARTQDALLERIAAALGEERAAEYGKLHATLFATDALEPLDGPRIKSRLIEIWLDELDVLVARKVERAGEVREWRDRHAALRLNLPRAFRLDSDRKARLEVVNRLSRTAYAELGRLAREWRRPWFERLRQPVFELIPVDWYFPPSTPYIDDCRDAGVPIPPGWGDSRWEYQDVLTDEFIDSSRTATVYVYRSTRPEGSCIALPRTDAAGDAGVFGIICLGIETENACFWDKYDTTASELAGDIPLAEWISGSNFTTAAGNCSSCHAGENPFVIHPGTALDIAAQGFPVQVDWHDPMFPPGWADNPGPIDLPSDTSYPRRPFAWWDPLGWFAPREPGSSCTTCHELPDVDHPVLNASFGSYCSSVLSRAAERTMPPASFDPTEHPAGWSSDNAGDYQVHIEMLNALCD